MLKIVNPWTGLIGGKADHSNVLNNVTLGADLPQRQNLLRLLIVAFQPQRANPRSLFVLIAIFYL